MTDPAPAPPVARPAAWKLALALALVYTSWGTTYLAIREGVKTLPPALFGGTRVALAGVLLLAWLRLRGGPVRLPRREALWAWLVGALMFVGGNGLVTAAEKSVPSGVAAVLAATTPLWMALLESLWPRGDRLARLGWLGLVAGLVGVAVLLSDQLLREPWAADDPAGPFLVLGSAACWAVGSFLHRHGPARGPHLATAAYQMALGGASLAVVGLLLGEAGAVTADALTPGAVFSFFYLLVVGSLVGFTAFTWVLGRTSAALAGTYAYVNPVIALLAGRLLAGEPLSAAVAAGMAVILLGVALVRAGAGRRQSGASAPRAPAPAEPAPHPIFLHDGCGVDKVGG
jgi:drug/metabolite transporter (DMT)-like permease